MNSRKTSETRKGLPTTGIPTVGHPPALTELNLRTRKKPEQWNNSWLREMKQPRTREEKYLSLGRNGGLRIPKAGGGSPRTITSLTPSKGAWIGRGRILLIEPRISRQLHTTDGSGSWSSKIRMT